MIREKELTNRKLTSLVTMIVGVIFLLLAGIIYWRYLHLEDLFFLLGAVLIGLILIYFSIAYFLDRYIFRKIKVIYKFIHDSKKSKSRINSNKDFNSIEDINKEVQLWAENTEKQIETFRTLEEYRKNFVGNISHELKTPIFSIQGYLHTLLDGGMYDENISESYLRRAAQNADRLQNIVEDLEEISKLESGKLILHVSKFDIKALIQEVFDDLELAAAEKGITIRFKSNSNKSYNVQADREAIRQVLNNLITNAVKYGKDGGTIRVGIYDVDSNVLIEVTDDGIGIEEQHVKHVFDRFYRADKSRSRNQGGSGLGLSIVKHIIEAHNQTITVRSTPNVGSTFGFTIKKVN